MNWYRDGYGMDGGSIVLMALMWLVIIGFGIWLVTWITRRDNNPPLQHACVVDKMETPRQILDRRFASGEIDADTYSQARKLIE
ncbi:MAG TPA: SHOCT domain-containing protein [Candidatus Paceibacterota bacterium]|nr:SHOCT domain-containing protein [Candidatus Paceibacterota bacterium]